MCYGVLWFIAGPRGESEADDTWIGPLTHAVGAFALGGALSCIACVCVYVERSMAERHKKRGKNSSR